jgi:hypothetical protein
MPAIPIASFLAGSLLTLLLPTIMLVLLVWWHFRTIQQAEKPGQQPQQAAVPVSREEITGSTEPGA